MLLNKLSTAQIKIIHRCASLMIDSFLRLESNGHELFDGLMEAYSEEDDLQLDISLQLLHSLELWEGIRDNPEANISKLSIPDLLMFKLVIGIIPAEGLPKSRNSIINHIDSIITLKETFLN